MIFCNYCGRFCDFDCDFISASKLLTVCAAEVYAVNANGEELLCATLLGTARNIDMTPRAK